MVQSHKPKVTFVLSVDTEEEWDWSGPFPQKQFSVDNVALIPHFQNFCNQHNIKPSYFVDYAVADDAESVAVLRQIQDKGEGEIAAHLHPWCNPPFYGITREKESHVINLPLAQVEKKLIELTLKLTKEFGLAPKAFRTGRWGISGDICQLLIEQGYKIDSSVYPFYTHKYFSCQGAPIYPYWVDLNNPLQQTARSALLEFPVSVGFNHKNFEQQNKLHQMFSSRLGQSCRAVGIAWHLGIVKKLYMCPELSTGSEMIALANNLLARKEKYIHMYLHSSNLMTNATGFVESKNAMKTILGRMHQVITHLNKVADVEFKTISQACEPYFQTNGDKQ
ncbi:polysaccharide deacetylase family protein [Catenovulum sp. 2E275]|uniref:polysaccharide deacetylase family protein n=1 Tax=Catenovulum sp. 2E275 TaxID=2980497 RepID=UPI0021D2107E|nr:polysaccharide deacetylase family protein [Catenovulum sp. 2E275]MCU4675560.1 polysaccharide deacetylase family protein [Catenovulum sp. 2E275]